jgi:hypothetical protein
MTRSDHNIGVARAQQIDHLRDYPFIVLLIGVHDNNGWRLGRECPFDACTGKTAPPDPANAPNPPVGSGNPVHRIYGPVG